MSLALKRFRNVNSFQNRPDSSKSSEDYRNDSRYYIYFFALAVLQLVFILILFLCDKKYQLIKLPHLHLHRRHFQTSTNSSVSQLTE